MESINKNNSEEGNFEQTRNTHTCEQPPWGWCDFVKVLIWSCIGFILACVLGAIVMICDKGISDTEKMELDFPIWLIPILLAIINIVLIWAVYRYTIKRYYLSLSYFGIKRFDKRWNVLLVFVLLIQFFGATLVNPIFYANLSGGNFENPQIELITGGHSPAPMECLYLVLSLCIVTPIAEEWFFRGMLHPLLRKKLSAWPAVILGAGLFSLVHFIPALVPSLFVIGLTITWVREKTDSIVPGMLLHACQNCLAIIIICAR